MEESLALDSYSDKDIKKLLNYGDELVEESRVELNAALQLVVDQVFGQEQGYKCEEKTTL